MPDFSEIITSCTRADKDITMISFPHANGYRVPLADFLQAWRTIVDVYAPAGDATAIPRLNSIQPMLHYIQQGKQLSLEYICRNLVPNGYRNTMQATKQFMTANDEVLEMVTAINPATGNKVNGARIRESAVVHHDLRPRVEALLEADCDDLETENNEDPPALATEGRASPDYEMYVERLVNLIHSEPYTPVFRGRPIGTQVQGWSNRLQTYFWPSPNTNYIAATADVSQLEAEATRLVHLLPNWSSLDEAAALTLANKIFAWGGVPQRQETVTPVNVLAVFNAAISGVVTEGDSLPPMNSGWTKVAAFASAHLETNPNVCPQVIWDSRVATAVTSRLETLFLADNLDSVPECFSDIGTVNVGRGGTRPRKLKLRWKNGYRSWTAQFGGSRLLAAIRNKLNSDSTRYGLMPGENGLGNWTSRGVEMVLFMDGY